MRHEANTQRHTRLAVTAAVCLVLSAGAADRLMRGWRGEWTATYTPLASPLSEVPTVIGSYVFDRDLPIDETVLAVADVDTFMNRDYVNPADRKRIGLYVGYWGRVNVGMGHGPDVCYPAVGWRPETAPRERVVQFSTAGGPSQATIALYRFTRTDHGGIERLAVAFSAAVGGRFQSASRGEFWHRPPTFKGHEAPFLAHIQVVGHVPDETWDATESALLGFLQELLPSLVNCFPRGGAVPSMGESSPNS
jgi:hypothetical protein